MMMEHWPRFRFRFRMPRSGWRRTATVNTILVGVFALLLICFLIAGSVKSGSIHRYLIFFEGNCDESTRLNLFLHLLLNVLSTAIIASSNFFMQVLNSPSRDEIDKAHANNHWLEIGVPSLRNVFFVSRFKTISWLVFTLSSIPIHLLFNSAVFETDYQGADFEMGMVSESFVNRSQYSHPGASFWPAGNSPSAWGESVTLADYDNPDFPLIKNVSVMYDRPGEWTVLDAKGCKEEYRACRGRRQFQSVVVVLNTGEDGAGWVPDQVYNMTAPITWLNDSREYETSTSETFTNSTTYVDYWKPYVSLDRENSLWFASACHVTAYHQSEHPPACDHTCAGAMGLRYSSLDARDTAIGAKDTNWTFPFVQLDGYYDVSYYTLTTHRPPYINNASNTLDVKYCLAQTFVPQCKVGLSNVLVLIITLCVIVKTIMCAIVIYRLPDNHPLVTPGDAVVSFMVYPDPTTVNKCTMSAPDLAWTRRNYAERTARNPKIDFAPGPRQWRRHWKYLASAIPVMAWVRTYGLFALVLAIVAVLMRLAMIDSPLGSASDTFGHSATNGLFSPEWFPSGQLIPSVLLANCPQLVLSFSYFAYNAFFTRLLVEKEWNSFSLDYRPIRVTAPEGEQWSTYRLQLPYIYSLPLLVISVLLHWLVSNTFYVYIIEGGYFSSNDYNNGNTQNSELVMQSLGLAGNTFVGIGFSTTAILTVFIISLFLITIPVALSFKKYAGSMVVAASNSMVISAACHCSPLDDTPPSSAFQDDSSVELQNLITPVQPRLRTEYTGYAIDAASERTSLMRLARSRVRWGAVRMPAAFYAQFVDIKEVVGHLSFGVPEHHVQPPEEGEWYA